MWDLPGVYKNMDSLIPLRARRVRRLALGTSAIASALFVVTPASAQCQPDPTQFGGTTECTGTDTDGLRITTNNTTVKVAASAVVTATGAAAISIELPSASYPYQRSVTVSVAGRVDGGGQAGISLLSGAIGVDPFDFNGTRLSLSVAEGGTVTGANGVTVGQSAGNTFASALASIDNAGTIIGTSGVALLSTAPTVAGFASIINRSTGFIGAIAGPVGTLTNAGTIDGGTRSAIDFGTGYLASVGRGPITNSGVIRSNGSPATIANINYGQAITNSGSIVNDGAGPALSGSGVEVINATGGRISTAGITAIAATDSLRLTNTGLISGNIFIGTTDNFGSASTVDSASGTIAGNVTFGSGADYLIARYTGVRTLSTGVTGAIDGGSGVDTVQIRFDTDTSVSTPVDLFPNFERLGLAPAAGVTATLEAGFLGTATIEAGGAGMIINRGTIRTAGQAVVTGFFSNPVRFSNEGTIESGVIGPDLYGLTFYSYGSFANSGTISTAGDGVSLRSGSDFANSGVIIAGGTGVSSFGQSFDNRGTIRSTAGTAVVLTGSYGGTRTNSGRIEGATVGTNLSASLINTGEILSNGVGVILQSYGVLDNRAGGVVSGGSAAIGLGPDAISIFNASILNAGTINGNVSTTNPVYKLLENNRFFALPGGILNGNLALGSGDYLVTELVNTGTGQFAGITGTVTGSGSNLRYRVRTDAAAGFGALPSGFQSVAYELFDNASLTLVGSAPSIIPVAFAGTGSVDITADIAVGNQPAIQIQGLIAPDGFYGTPSGLSITSRGNLTLDTAGQSGFAYAVVALGAADSFTNAGTITVRDGGASDTSNTSAITGGNAIVNSGAIALNGGVAVRYATSFTNTGTISQLVGGAAARGVENVSAVINNGTISVGGVAVLLDYNSFNGSLQNSGTIVSTGSSAVRASTQISVTNLASGLISAAGRPAVQMSGGLLTNAGSIIGDVDLAYTPYGGVSSSAATYVAQGGSLNGNLRFGAGGDLFLETGDGSGVSGIIDGGAGFDIFGHSRSASGTVTLGAVQAINFEAEYVEALGADTTVTTSSTGPLTGDLYLGGDGNIVNGVDITGGLITQRPAGYFPPFSGAHMLASLTNTAAVRGYILATAHSFSNSGTVGSAALRGTAVQIDSTDRLTFTNSGRITSGASTVSVYLTGTDVNTLKVTNSGIIEGGGLVAELGSTAAATLTVDNSGTITATGLFGTGVGLLDYAAGTQFSVTNSGTIQANDGGTAIRNPYSGRAGTLPAFGIHVEGDASATATITNATTGIIGAKGPLSTTITTAGPALVLDNAGTITGGAGTTLAANDGYAITAGTTYLAGAIQSLGSVADSITNSGTITGSIDLGGGDDRIVNTGTINGNVFLRAGDDTFLQRASATLIGTVDAGAGVDTFIVDATGGGAINGDQFVNFERFMQTGTGSVAYSGAFTFNTIDVSGGTVTVAAGQTLASTGAITISGGAGSESVINDGTIAGGIDLDGGSDSVVNNGLIGGSVALGSGDDSFTEGAGSHVAGLVDGGAGTDTYRVVLAGDRNGIGYRSNFEQLALTGTGTLLLGLDQNFATVTLAGTSLSAQLNGFTIGQVTGSDANETLVVDGDVGAALLGGGNDLLALGTNRAAGLYDGGIGLDTLRFDATSPVTLTGSATGFERLALAGNALTVQGTLGTTGAPLSFGDGDQALTLAAGGRIAGTIDLGAGNDSFRWSAGGILQGSVSGGAGTDSIILDLATDTTVSGNTVRDFEIMSTEGSATLTLTEAFALDRLNLTGNLTVATGASLVAGQLRFGAGDNRLIIDGGFSGSVDGGVGTDSIRLTGGSQAAPVAFGSIANVESFGMTGGFATIAGTGSFDSMQLGGGRLIGLAGSVITAPQIMVGAGATFGSAGTVNGNVVVAGTLSPGASPGTMTVNGNVSLGGGSISVFEFTPPISDKLLVNGTLTIANGATLQLVGTQAVTPGATVDLIVASDGITGSYTNIVRPASLFGFVVQDAKRIQLVGQFLSDARFSPQVRRSIGYVNAVLTGGQASAGLLAALPKLMDGSGTNPVAFAQITPEAYASVRQLAVQNGLTLADAGRGDGFAADGDTPGFFTFGSGLLTTQSLASDAGRGTARAQTNGYGFLGGIGWGSSDWAVGVFAGYLDNRQRIESLGAQTDADGAVVGIHGRVASGAFGLKATIAYDGGSATTRRVVPGGTTIGHFGLHAWTGDIVVDYAVPLGGQWAVIPSLGVTVIRSTRNAVNETGGSPFALNVVRSGQTAAFIDGALTLRGDGEADAAIKPYLTVGVRYQPQGRDVDALASLGGGNYGLLAEGAARARVVGTAELGGNVALSSQLTLFGAFAGQAGDGDRHAEARAGLRLNF